MPFSALYDNQNGIIAGNITGEVNGQLLKEYSVETKNLCQQYNCHLILTDYRNASFSFSVVDIYRLPEKHNELLNSLGLNIHAVKRASVFNQNTAEMAKFFEDVAVNRGQRFKAFSDKEKALEWLLNE